MVNLLKQYKFIEAILKDYLLKSDLDSGLYDGIIKEIKDKIQKKENNLCLANCAYFIIYICLELSKNLFNLDLLYDTIYRNKKYKFNIDDNSNLCDLKGVFILRYMVNIYDRILQKYIPTFISFSQKLSKSVNGIFMYNSKQILGQFKNTNLNQCYKDIQFKLFNKLEKLSEK